MINCIPSGKVKIVIKSLRPVVMLLYTRPKYDAIHVHFSLTPLSLFLTVWDSRARSRPINAVPKSETRFLPEGRCTKVSGVTVFGSNKIHRTASRGGTETQCALYDCCRTHLSHSSDLSPDDGRGGGHYRVGHNCSPFKGECILDVTK